MATAGVLPSRAQTTWIGWPCNRSVSQDARRLWNGRGYSANPARRISLEGRVARLTPVQPCLPLAFSRERSASGPDTTYSAPGSASSQASSRNGRSSGKMGTTR